MDAVPDPQEAMSCWRYRFEKNRSRWIPLDDWMDGVSPNPIQSHPIPLFHHFPHDLEYPLLGPKKNLYGELTSWHRQNKANRIPASLIVMDVIHSCSCARLMLIVTIFFVGRSGVPQFDGWSSFSTLRLPYIYIKSYKRIHIYIYTYIYHNHWYPHHIPIFSSLNHRSSWIHRKRPPQIWLDKCCIAWGSGHGMSCPGSEKHGISCGISWG